MTSMHPSCFLLSPRPKACGECANPTGVKLLIREMNLCAYLIYIQSLCMACPSDNIFVLSAEILVA